MQKTHTPSHEELVAVMASIEIPPCPASVTQVMAEAQKDAPDLGSLTRIIAGDVGMSAFAVKLANSPLYRRAEPANSVPKAVARLGINNIVCVVVAAALRQSLSGDLPASMLESFWDKAGATAMASGLAARKLRGIMPDIAYTYGLFHDAAVPVLMRRFPDYGDVLAEAIQNGSSLVAEENRRFHCTHALVGGLLARNWGLPASVADAIRHHHDPGLYGPGKSFLNDASLALVSVTHVAEHLLGELRGEEEPDVSMLFPEALAYLGLAEDDLHDLREALVNA